LKSIFLRLKNYRKSGDAGFDHKKNIRGGKRAYEADVIRDDASLMMDDTKENILGTDDSFSEEVPQKNVKKRRGRPPSVTKKEVAPAGKAGANGRKRVKVNRK
jgi:hypothetical protein